MAAIYIAATQLIWSNFAEKIILNRFNQIFKRNPFRFRTQIALILDRSTWDFKTEVVELIL